MFLRKKSKPVFELRLEKYFDNGEATERYRLVKYEIIKGKLQDEWYWMGSGDKEWSKKIAKHYGLTITTPINEED